MGGSLFDQFHDSERHEALAYELAVFAIERGAAVVAAVRLGLAALDQQHGGGPIGRAGPWPDLSVPGGPGHTPTPFIRRSLSSGTVYAPDLEICAVPSPALPSTDWLCACGRGTNAEVDACRALSCQALPSWISENPNSPPSNSKPDSVAGIVLNFGGSHPRPVIVFTLTEMHRWTMLFRSFGGCVLVR